MRKRKTRLMFFIFAVVATLFLVGMVVFVWWRENRHGILTVVFLDVGKGDAVYIETPHGKKILIDGGIDASVMKKLGEVMPFYSRSLDMFVLTAPTIDHLGGALTVFERLSITAVLESGADPDNLQYKAFEKEIAQKNIHKIIGRRGINIGLDQDVELSVLWPEEVSSGVKANINDDSLILRLAYGTTSVVFMGNASQKVERALLADAPQGTVLMAGHHGSRVSSSPEWLKAVSPKYAVISVDAKNKYGYPNPQTLEAFRLVGAKVFTTAGQGSVIFKTDGKSFTISQSQ